MACAFAACDQSVNPGAETTNRWILGFVLRLLLNLEHVRISRLREVVAARAHGNAFESVRAALISASAIVKPIAPAGEQMGMHEIVNGVMIQKTMDVLLKPLHGGCDSEVERVPTSVIIEQLLASAPPGHVTLEWLFANLRRRSFGLVMLILGSIAILPGVCALAGLVLLILSVQMLMGREVPVLPQFMASRPLPQAQFVRLAKRMIPPIRSLERFISPRWQTPLEVTRRGVGLGLLLMAVTLFVPIPLSNVVPGILIMFVALAYLEGDGLLLILALVGSLISFLGMLLAAQEATRGALFLSHV